jgi:dolichol-phosphate mannosyltransferase
LKESLERDFSSLWYEIIFIDDGSSDRTFSFLKSISARDSFVKVIKLSRNFGHYMALTAGLDQATGDYIVTMDGDLQDKPDQIKFLFATIEKDFDIVYGVRKERKDSFFKKVSSEIFWFTLLKLSSVSMIPNQGMFRIFNRKVLHAINSIREIDRFFPGLFAWVGYRQGYCEVEHGARFSGKSKYGFLRMFSLTLNALMGFSSIILSWISVMGLCIAGISFLLGVRFLFLKLTYEIMPIGWASLAILISFLSGVILFSIGILGIYIEKLYRLSLRRPLYLVSQKLGFEKRKESGNAKKSNMYFGSIRISR